MSLSRILTLSMISLATIALGQDPAEKVPDSSLNRGISPLGSYSIDDIETINNVTGNLVLNIPVATLPPGRGGSSYGVSVVYNSAIFDTKYSVLAVNTNDILKQEFIPSMAGGWHYGFQYSLGWETRPTEAGLSCQALKDKGRVKGPYHYYRAFLTMPDGSRKTLRLQKSTDTATGIDRTYSDWEGDAFYPVSPVWGQYLCAFPEIHSEQIALPVLTATTKMIYVTVDGSYIRVEANPQQKTWTIFMADGTTVSGSVHLDANGLATDSLGASVNTAPYSSFPLFIGRLQTITDRNGNAIQITPVCSATGPCTTTITDGFSGTYSNRKIVITYGSSQDTITWLGPPKEGVPVNTLTARINHSSFTLPSHQYVCGGDGELVPLIYCNTNQITLRRVQSIALPSPVTAGATGREYTFSTTCPACLPSSFSGWGEVHSWTVSPAPSSTNIATVSYTYAFDDEQNGLARRGGNLVHPIARKTMTYTRPADDISANTLVTQYTHALASPISTVTVSTPDNASTQYSYLSDPLHPETNGLLFNVLYPDGSSLDYSWAQNPPPATPNNSRGNPYVKAVARSRPNSGGIFGRYSGAVHTIDKNGNIIQVDEYDLQNGPITVVGSGNSMMSLASFPSNVSPLRKTASTYHAPTYAAELPVTESANAYWNSGAPQFLGAIKSSTTAKPGTSSDTVVAVAQVQYDNPSTTGNPTEVLRWDSTRGNYTGELTTVVPLTVCGATNSDDCGIKVSRTYTCGGSLSSTTDPGGTSIQITYDGNCLYPTQISNAGLRYSSYQFDSASGYLESVNDTDNSVTTEFTYDLLGRLTKSQEAAGSLVRSITTDYNDLGLTVMTKQDKATANDGALVTTTKYDALGRVRLITDPAGNSVKKAYFPCTVSQQQDCGASYELTSNPYTTMSDASMGWTLITRNVVGPFANNQGSQPVPSVKVQHYSGGTPPISFDNDITTLGGNTDLTGTATLTEDGNQEVFTAKDEAGVTHTYQFDGLGRMSSADAFTYNYDALDNLLGVQSPQGRTFSYSSLSRLTQATNPESGTVSYKYDDNGNPLLITDARSKVICFGNWTAGACDSSALGYDGLNRPRRKSYNDGTPSVTYSYDQDTKGTLSSVVTSAGQSTVYTHDLFGRITGSTQTTPGATAPFPFVYEYNLADFLKSVEYPSGRTIEYTSDAANRVVSVADPGKTQPYASNIQYSPVGPVAQMTFGNSRTEARDLNARLQTRLITLCPGTSCGDRSQPLQTSALNLLNLELTYDPTENNGNVKSQIVSAFGAFNITQSYGYDGRNRLISAGESKIVNEQETGWSQTYNYDALSLSNRWVTQTAQFPSMWPPGFSYSTFTPTGSSNYPSGTNQIDVGTPAAMHDAAGNQTSVGAYVSVFDAEGRLVSMTVGTTDRTQFRYDGEGNRVVKLVCPNANPCVAATPGVEQTVYVYDAGGYLAAEYSNLTPASPCETCYVTTDHLGSTRVLTDASGNVVRRYDYLPFGEEIPADGTTRTAGDGYQAGWDDFTMKFIGQLRDIQTGLDYFHARYYSPAQGRFVSPDDALVDQHTRDPLSWNLYAYARNNPLRYFDLNGQQASCPSAYVCAQPPPPSAAGSTQYPVPNFFIGLLKGFGQALYGFANFNRELGMTPEGRWMEEQLRSSNTAQQRGEFVGTVASMLFTPGPRGTGLVEEINPNLIRFSQRSVNEVGPRVLSMRLQGWVGEPIDVVRMADGGLTALDNTRVLAASRSGINVRAIVHEATDPISPEVLVNRFRDFNVKPRTWGEAVQIRINRQGTLFRSLYPNGSWITGAADVY